MVAFAEMIIQQGDHAPLYFGAHMRVASKLRVEGALLRCEDETGAEFAVDQAALIGVAEVITHGPFKASPAGD